MPITTTGSPWTTARRGHPHVDHRLVPSLEQMEQLVAMGMEEGLTAAMGQMDDVLAAA